jgi:isoquinoline 1-oxidoreductase beta subunit
LLRGGALVISGALFPGAAFGQASNRAGAVSLTAWVKITTDNRVTLVASQSEMGQGTTTTLAAALADELYLPLNMVNIAFAPFNPAYRDPVYNWMFTGNSQGTSSFYNLMRRMGAAARAMLTAAAAQRWNVAATAVTAENGALLHPDRRRRLSYGELAAEAAKQPIPEKPALRERAVGVERRRERVHQWGRDRPSICREAG